MTLFPRLEAPDGAAALQIGEHSLTYRDLAGACAAHLEWMDERGVRPGDRVAVFAQPRLETAVALVAHALGGIVSIPVNASIGERELEHVVRDAQPALVLAADPAALSVAPGMPVERIDVTRTSATRRATRPVADDPVFVVYTSGTTGAPKGAVLTAKNLADNLDALARAWSWSERDVLVHALPLFHVHGLVLGLFGVLRVGASVRIHAKFQADALAADLGQNGSMLFGVPTMYHRLAEAAEHDRGLAEQLSRARMLVSGSAPLPLREHQRITSLTGQRIIERYGLTETLIVCAMRHDGERRAGYVGPALDGVELQLVDDARRPIDACDDATLGEVAVRGPSVFQGYWQRPEATASVRDENGWFYTGDLAARAGDGYVRIVGRKATDLIKTGGYKVGAGEVEAALLEHPEVLEAAVIGAPDDDLGEKIVAFVVVRGGARLQPSVLADHVARLLAPHKRPRVVRLVGELPRNPMGKVLKRALRKME